MNTADHLEKMTDRGKFEKLANSILRDDDPLCKNLIPFGINSQGETIRGPNDGFWKVPGSSPSHYVYLQHTTTNLKDLKRKWLSPNKDLEKVEKSTHKLKRKDPKSKFSVILSTNQRIPSDEWLSDIYTKGDKLGLEIIVYGQAKYVDYLDTRPRGHYLRRKYFQINAELLSRDLLHELCVKSCEQYRENYLQFSDHATWIERDIEREIKVTFKNVQDGAIFLFGDSGYGKSVIAYRLLEQYLEDKNLGIFIPEGIIDDSLSLEEALRKILMKQYPSLTSEQVKRLPEIIGVGSPFLIVVDDINRSDAQELFINKLTSWAENPFCIICPAHSKYMRLVNHRSIQRIKKNDHGMPPHLSDNVFIIDRMSTNETCKALREICDLENIPMSQTSLAELSEKLNNDPWLIGEFSRQIKSYQDLNRCADVSIEESIKRRLDQVLRGGDNFLERDYFDVLISLSILMLQNYNIHPDWKVVKDWFKNEKEIIDVLRSLCNFRNLCYESSEGQFLFLHERFRDFFLSKAMSELFKESDSHLNLLSDPYYADFIGQALIKNPQPNSTLDLLIEKNPLSVVIALRFIGEPTQEYHHKIFRRVKNWIIINADNYSGSSPEYLRGEIAFSLLQTDSSIIFDLPETDFGLQKNWLGWLVRLRNGDARGAIKYCNLFGMSFSQDGLLFYNLMEHAKVFHKEKLIQSFVSETKSTDTIKRAKSELIVAGFIAEKEFFQSIIETWGHYNEKQKLLIPATWAALRCSPNYYDDPFIESLMRIWNEQKGNIDILQLDQLAWLLYTYADDALVDFLISIALKYPSLENQIARICSRISQPNALEFVIKSIAELEEESDNYFFLNWGSQYSPRLSSECVEFLRKLWGNLNEKDSIRILEFNLWIKNNNYQESELLPILHEISEDNPLFEEAIRQRAIHGDRECVPYLVKMLKLEPKNFYYAQHVWCKKIKLVVEDYLQNFSLSIPKDYSGGRCDEHYILAHLFRNLPVHDVDLLLDKYWDHIKFSPLFVQAALYTGTEKSLSLAEDYIEKCSNKEDIFKYIDQYFNILGYGASPVPVERKPPFDVRKIYNLKPYLDYIDDSCLRSFAAVCYLFGEESIYWCQENFSKEMNDRYRKIYCPTEEDLMEMFDTYTHQNKYLFMERINKFNLSTDYIFALLGKWLETDLDFNKLRFVSECILLIGKRKDLRLLDVTPLDIPIYQREFKKIKQNVEFAVKRRSLE